jgi:hypothetical protein
MVPSPVPVAVQTVLALGSAAMVHVTGLLLPVTDAVYCTVLAAVGVVTGTDAGDTGDEVTFT